MGIAGEFRTCIVNRARWLDCCSEGNDDVSQPSFQASLVQRCGFRRFCGFNTLSSKSANTIVENFSPVVLLLLHSHLLLGFPECFTFQRLV